MNFTSSVLEQHELNWCILFNDFELLSKINNQENVNSILLSAIIDFDFNNKNYGIYILFLIFNENLSIHKVIKLNTTEGQLIFNHLNKQDSLIIDFTAYRKIGKIFTTEETVSRIFEIEKKIETCDISKYSIIKKESELKELQQYLSTITTEELLSHFQKKQS